MRDEWVLEVLEDLRRFADANSLPALAAKVDETLLIARAELAGFGCETAVRPPPLHQPRKAN